MSREEIRWECWVCERCGIVSPPMAIRPGNALHAESWMPSGWWAVLPMGWHYCPACRAWAEENPTGAADGNG